MGTQIIEVTAQESGEVQIPVTTRTEAFGGRPDPQWVRGKCPCCGDDVVSNLYYIGGRGYLLRWECWSSLGENPTCGYFKVI